MSNRVKRQTKAMMVDALGETEERIARLKARASILRGKVGKLGVGYHKGKTFVATVAAVLDVRGGVQVFINPKDKR